MIKFEQLQGSSIETFFHKGFLANFLWFTDVCICGYEGTDRIIFQTLIQNFAVHTVDPMR